MRVNELLDIAAPTFGDRVLFTDSDRSLTAAQLASASSGVAALLGDREVERLAFVGENSVAVPMCLYGAAAGGVPFAPINYRLADDRLRSLLARTAPSMVVVDDAMVDRVSEVDGVHIVTTGELTAAVLTDSAPAAPSSEPDSTAVLLFTSGTTGEPKAAILAHENVTAYVLATVDFAAAGEDEAAIVSVPPYHVAGVTAALTSVFAGRRTVYLPAFDAQRWVETVRRESVTQAMVVPTMLERILASLDDGGLPDLRSLSYGGGPMPESVIARALEMLPHVDFVNAYGLTETASTISILGPDDHRIAHQSDDPAIRRRLRSVGRPLPTVELTIRDASGSEVSVGERGEVWVRGDQVSGRYAGVDEGNDDGWFHTRDAGEIDGEGYLYLHGRLDDVIIRGGENLSPGEIEHVLIDHPAVAACAVVGVPDDEWGEAVVAAVVLAEGAAATAEELQEHVRAQLRSTQTPEEIRFYDELPMNETGKLLRRVLREDFAAAR